MVIIRIIRHTQTHCIARCSAL